MGMFNLEHRGQICEYCFLNTDSRLSHSSREEIVRSTMDAYLDRQKTKKIKGEGYEGRIKTDNRQFVMGSFGGQKFEIILETNFGKMNLACLVAKRINASLN